MHHERNGPVLEVRLVVHQMFLDSDGDAPHLGLGAVLFAVAVLHIRTSSRSMDLPPGFPDKLAFQPDQVSLAIKPQAVVSRFM
jgi:hypothetical protein